MTKKKKEPRVYTNEQPPYMDVKWNYNDHTDVMNTWKRFGFVPPTERKKTK